MFDGSTFSGEAPAGSWWPGAGALSRELVMRYISPRRIVLLATLVLLIAPWASAAPRPGSTPPANAFVGIGIPDVLSLAWRFITGGWIKEGCQLDPGGRCITISAPVSHPVGAPGGHHGDRRPALPTKVGCQIDPGGHCLSDPATLPLTSADTGCQIDPGGHCIS